MKHNNPSISEDMVRQFNLKTGESTNIINDVIIPNIPINPRVNIVQSNSAFNATSAVVYTTPSDKDFYITACNLSTFRDATATSTQAYLTVYIDGIMKTIMSISAITLTAGNGEMASAFPYPIKADRGTDIAVRNTTAVGNVRTNAVIMGYTQETVKGV